MRFLATLSQFFYDLWAQRLRTTLTILGITWGTVAVIVLLAFGVGLEKQSRKNMHGMGDGIVVMFGGRTTKSFEGFPDGREIPLREEDAMMLAREISEIESISPEYIERNTAVRVGQASTMPAITGIYPVYGDMRNVIAEPGGRFINTLDMQNRRRVAVLGNEIKRLLFADEDAIGKQIMVGEAAFTVVGVMQPKTQNSSYNSRDSDRMFIPASTHKSLFGDRYVNNIIYQPADPLLSEAIETRVYEVMGRRNRFDPTDEDALGIWDTNEADKFMRAFFLGFNIFMGVIGSFTLTVGGIGVANIMYVVVRERTREIGVKRSVGARRRDILMQFFGETFLIVGIGATLGFGIAVGLVKALAFLPIQDAVGTPEVSPMVAVTTMALLAIIAFLAGFFPARKASRLDPVECLRT
ncbi:MAG: ABC transporter permease [Rhodothermales bacterium]|nr:ABC transporter permease [Rhodothermales bacterium]